MNVQLSSIISIVFVLMGLFTVLIMLKLHGNPKEKIPMKLLRNVHRILGYVFLVYFLLMMVLMLTRVNGISAEFSPRVVVHMVLAVMIIPLFLTKILIARFFKRLFPNLILLGLAIFILFFTLVAISGGYNLFRGADTVSAVQKGKGKTEQDNLQNLKVSEQFKVTVKELIRKKCTICHDLNRVKGAQKTREQWLATVDKMIKYNINADFLSESEKNLVVSFLSSDWKKNL